MVSELYAIERLNAEVIALENSKTYQDGLRYDFYKNLVKKHKVARFLAKNMFNKARMVHEPTPSDNWDEAEWQKMLHYGNPEQRVAIYTCITGGYDTVKEPMFRSPNADYILYSDDPDILKGQESAWEYRPIPEITGLSGNSKINRYIKMHPFELFEKEYDYAIYLDGTVRPVSDITVLTELIDSEVGLAIHNHRYRDCIYEEQQVCEAIGKGNAEQLKAQTERYRGKGFPEKYGLAECTVLVTDLKSGTAKDLYAAWWEEFCRSESGRDQMSFPYVVWKSGIRMEKICTLGKNLYRNPKIRIYSH